MREAANPSIPTDIVTAVRLLTMSFLLLVSTLAIAADTNTSLRRMEFHGALMGTKFTITLFDRDQSHAEAAVEAAFRRIADLERIMSDYEADSELNLLCQDPAGKPVPVSTDLFDILVDARKFSEISDGAFDVTVGPYVRLWRFARKRKVMPSFSEIAAAREAVGWRYVELDPGSRTVTLRHANMRLDLGGIAKGYAADQALEVLKSRGIARALIAASGDIAIGEPPPGHSGWRISITGLNTQTNTGSNAPTLVLRNAAVSTSGDTEQFIEIEGVRYSHIVSPRTGLGLTQRIQATIVAPNATSTDALATAVCILGPVKGLAMIERLPKTYALVVFEENGRLLSVPSRGLERVVELR